MRKILIRTGTGEAYNAASKARRDADAIACAEGYEPFIFRGERTGDGSLFRAICLAWDGWRNWRNLIRSAELGSLVLVQYPHYPMKSAFLMKRMIPIGKKKKDLRFIALVHDLDSLRGLHGKAAVYSDGKVLPLFDAIICHNEKMKAYLGGKGIFGEKLVSLGLFDYLTDAQMQEHTPEEGIAVAGNLDPEKCAYLPGWMKEMDLPVHLYGKGLWKETDTEKSLPVNVIWHGTFPPEELPGVIAGGFGLVWNGPSAETCEGPTGEYLRWNNPHKMSLYLASGMPVILWKEAALAGFVLENGVGLTVSGPEEAKEAIRSVSVDNYLKMAGAAKAAGEQVRAGAFLRRALKEAERKAAK